MISLVEHGTKHCVQAWVMSWLLQHISQWGFQGLVLWGLTLPYLFPGLHLHVPPGLIPQHPIPLPGSLRGGSLSLLHAEVGLLEFGLPIPGPPAGVSGPPPGSLTAQRRTPSSYGLSPWSWPEGHSPVRNTYCMALFCVYYMNVCLFTLYVCELHRIYPYDNNIMMMCTKYIYKCTFHQIWCS